MPLNSNTQDQLNSLLKEKFNLPHFRGAQHEVIARLLDRKSTLALMPTGTGKSLCYQIFSFLKPTDSVIVVVSPLIALIQDQVLKAKNVGIKAAALHSAMSGEDKEKVLRLLEEKKIDLILVTPERFKSEAFNTVILKQKVHLFVVDEAHCASLWGHDFRPDYSRLGEIAQKLGRPTILGLTATATPEVQKDICRILNLKYDTDVILGGIERPELSLNISEIYGESDKFDKILEEIQNQKEQSGIVYFSLIQTLEKFSSFLNSKKINHTKYHGDLPAHIKNKNQKLFVKNEVPLILATPAFGLGVDKANVRYVLHAEVPSTLEAYFQEVGRGGRDGQDARSVLFYDEDDVSIQMRFLDWAYPDKEFIKKVYHLISKETLRVKQEGIQFLNEQMVFKNKNDFRVTSAIGILSRWGCLEEEESPFGYHPVVEPTSDIFDEEDQSILKKDHQKKLLSLLRYIKNDQDCRLRQIYHYFGYEKKEDCQKCDVCRG